MTVQYRQLQLLPETGPTTSAAPSMEENTLLRLTDVPLPLCCANFRRLAALKLTVYKMEAL